MDVCLGSVVVRTLDLRSTDSGFNSRPPPCRASTLDKSFTPMCSAPLKLQPYGAVEN